MRYIAGSYADAQLDVNRIVKATSISRRMLEKIFQRHLNRTVNEEVLRVRLVKAREMLAAAVDLKVAEAAMATGFSRPNHFHRAFKKYFGMTPSAYRKDAGPKSRTRKNGV